MFKIKTEYKLQILTNETMALFGDGPIVDQDENGVNVPELEQVHSVLLHCNVVIYRTANYYILLFETMLLDNYFLSNRKH